VVADVTPSMVRRPSRGHISKTKQDRPIFTMEHYYEVGPLILLPGLGDCTLLGNALLTRHNLSKRYRLPDSVAGGGADFYHMGDILVASDI